MPAKEGTRVTQPKTAVAKAKKARAKMSGSVAKRRAGKMAKQPVEQIVVQHKPLEVPEGLPRKYLLKSTFNTHDIMHSPVEKTLKMIDKILTGERLFTM
jgi:hypothetical protein